MTTICLNNKYYEMPTAWNELNQTQLISSLDIIENDWTAERKLLALLKLLSGISYKDFAKCPTDELAEFIYLLDFLFDDNTLTKNLLPSYRKLFGPADFLQNIISCEYIFTEKYYLDYKANGATEDLDSLIGILYRKGKNPVSYSYKNNPDGDIRKPFNDNLVSHYASNVKNWPAYIKRIILHFYEGCRQQLIVTYADCFGGSGEPAQRGMLSLVIMMAETGTFGNFDNVEKLLLHTFFIGLSENIAMAKRTQPKAA